MDTHQKRRPRRKYTEQFKQEAVNEVLNGRPAAEVAENLGISSSLLCRWKAECLGGGWRAGDPLSPAVLEAELRSLRKKLREAERERDILKKALIVFSRGKSGSSTNS